MSKEEASLQSYIQGRQHQARLGDLALEVHVEQIECDTKETKMGGFVSLLRDSCYLLRDDRFRLHRYGVDYPTHVSLTGSAVSLPHPKVYGVAILICHINATWLRPLLSLTRITKGHIGHIVQLHLYIPHIAYSPSSDGFEGLLRLGGRLGIARPDR